jgi:hypothetical protein
VGLDFSQLGKTSAVGTSTDPRRIFNALPAKDSRYSYPRAGQTEVWEGWHQRRDENDLVIKMNTGAGKTVVGLLILKSCLNEGVGPAVYLCPDNYLRDQVRQEADLLGLETTDDPRSPRFQQAKDILVVSIYRLVNGQSVFGVTGDGRDPIELGTVLIDDVHACLATVEDQFTLTIARDHAAYDRLFQIFHEDLYQQSAPSTQDLENRFGYPTLLIPYWSWADRQQAVLTALQPHRDEADFKFRWPLISECLAHCRVAIANDQIEIKPPVPPIHRITSFASAKRRIYLTATLPDDSVLITHFNARPASVTLPIAGKTADDLGDRMILTPLETHPDANEKDLQAILRRLADLHNVVVIVPSNRRAEAWKAIADAVYDKDTINAGVDALRKGRVGLVVLINKYDGIDLPDAACRVLVIDGLPEAYSPLDRIDAVTVGASEAITTRQIQRIEQGMGRGVRSSTDYCVVILLGARLTQRLNSGGGYARLSPATRVQIDLSRKVAEMLQGKPLASLADVISQCLSRDVNWVTASRAALVGVSYSPTPQSLVEAATYQRQAFDQAEIGRPRQAFELMQKGIALTGEPRQRGWLKQQAAAYLHPADQVQAQKMQTSAQTDNRALLKPRGGVEYERLSGSAEQAVRAADYLSGKYEGELEFQLGLQAVLDDLLPDPDSTAVQEFEQAICDLGEHLGFEAQRPERDTGSGPDVLWKVGATDFLIIECKSGVTTDFIAKNDAAQLSGSIDWFKSKYDKTWSTPTPLMVHRSERLHPVASPTEGMRVITFDRLAAVRTATASYGRALATSGGFRDSKRINEQLQALRLTGSTLVNSWSIAPRK